MLLQTDKISIKRGNTPTLSFPDLTIAKGDRILLRGSSGAGKSTLLSILSGLLLPTEGKILFDGSNIFEMPMTERDAWRARTIGFVFQSFHLLPSLTVLQNIMLAADLAKTKPAVKEVQNLLQKLGLSEKSQSRPQDLSQGQQQRAAIARAIVNKPALLIADEPTSALDDEHAIAVLSLLETQAQETGAALLIASHDFRIMENFKKIIHLDSKAQKVAA